MSLLLAVLSGYVLALAAPWVARRQPRAAGWVLAILPLALFAYFLSFLPVVLAGQTVRETVPWVPSLGITLSFTVDGLSLVFALLILGIGALVVIYAGGYLHGHRFLRGSFRPEDLSKKRCPRTISNASRFPVA